MEPTSETSKSPAGTKIIFFGNERLATGVSTTAPTLQALLDVGYDVVAVVSHNSDSASRKPRPLEIAQVAEKHHIPILLPEKPAEIIDQLLEFGADIAVLVAYGKIVPQSVIDIFPRGIINIHPSLLPLHRGPTPIESVILDGSTETGVSIMHLVRSMDAGPVYAQSRVGLSGNESKQQLADSLLAEGGKLLVSHLPAILDGILEPTAQDEDGATYDELIRKEHGLLEFAKSSEQLAREIRAYAVWPKSRMILGGKDVVITAAHAVPSQSADNKPGDLDIITDTGVLMITTARGSLCIDRLIPAGKSEMTASAFLAGYGKLLQ